MVSGTNISQKGAKNAGKVKEKILHPSSRKAGQQERASLRKSKLATASAKRSQKQIEKGKLILCQSAYQTLNVGLLAADSVGFWFHALPPDSLALTLEEIHTLIRDVWLHRFDEAIHSEESSRRKGRPPSKREVELRALKTQAEQEYRSGVGTPLLSFNFF